jgi:hypothetical protein
MSLLCRTRLGLALCLALVVISGVHAADDPPKEPAKFKKDNVTFRTVDYVDLRGTLWTPSTTKKNCCVMLLHNLSRKSGGNRNDDGWDALAEDLAKEGYTVLSFDFRGHGDSTAVAKDFWDFTKFPHNRPILPKGKVIMKVDDYPSKIDYKDFPVTGSYYLHFVDDIAAAKVFLDSKGGGAAGNTVLIGAGEGATLGALWLNSEHRLYREKTENGMPGMRYNPEPDPEGKDIACAIWLSISQNIDRKRQDNLNTWLDEVAGKRNALSVPMLFMYGKDDPTGKSTAGYALRKMMPAYQMMEATPGPNKDKNHPFTRDWSVDTKLEGSQLLQKSLNTNTIIKAYLKDVMEDRGSRESKRHDPEKFRFFWTIPSSRTPVIAKESGEQFMLPIPVSQLGGR